MKAKLLRLNLSTEKIRREAIDAKTTKEYVGGRGLGVRIPLSMVLLSQPILRKVGLCVVVLIPTLDIQHFTLHSYQ